jgi:3-oxoacyl-[acyl-carrier protein] reductase
MDLGLENKVAFIAASSDGLGKAVAAELANEGAHIIICGRNTARLQSALEELNAIGNGTVHAIEADLTIASDRKRLIAKALSYYPVIDILVTNSGGPPTGQFTELDPKEWQKAFDQLLVSTTDLVRGFLPGMQQQRWGRIISITSQAVKQPVNNLILSNSIRASVVGLMKTLATELGPDNITVNNVMPGYTSTSRLERLIEANPAFKNATTEIPLGRFGQPNEFASAVAFLASNRASYITGVSLPIDGGWIQSII